MILLLPLSTFLVSCGATPSEEARGVNFVSDIYDEESGKAVFEVDLAVKTKLVYKCNPTTTAAKINFTIPVEGQVNSSLNRSRFTFENGEIIVNDLEFEQIEVKITVDSFTDQCIVRLKEYPKEIYPTESEVVINAGSSYTICPVGKFENNEERFLLEENFNFTVESDNETLISVSKEDRLTVYSSRQNSATATVTVTLNDTTGKAKNLSFKIKFIIVEPASEGFLRFKDFDKFVHDGETLSVDSSLLTANENGEYELSYNAYFISNVGTIIKDSGKLTGSSNNSEYISFDNENQIIKIKSTVDVKIQVSIWTNLIKPDGSAFRIVFDIDFKA